MRGGQVRLVAWQRTSSLVECVANYTCNQGKIDSKLKIRKGCGRRPRRGRGIRGKVVRFLMGNVWAILFNLETQLNWEKAKLPGQGLKESQALIKPSDPVLKAGVDTMLSKLVSWMNATTSSSQCKWRACPAKKAIIDRPRPQFQ